EAAEVTLARSGQHLARPPMRDEPGLRDFLQRFDDLLLGPGFVQRLCAVALGERAEGNLVEPSHGTRQPRIFLPEGCEVERQLVLLTPAQERMDALARPRRAAPRGTLANPELGQAGRFEGVLPAQKMPQHRAVELAVIVRVQPQ